MSAPVTAQQIMALLADKHAGDVFVPECKTGSSWNGCRRMDAWAIRRSWSPWETIGYEVKVSRSDFEADQKWVEYLGACHKFSFVCPAGLIKATDLPPGVGLLWCSPNAKKLHVKVKAARREPDLRELAMLQSYVLMSRTRIVAGMAAANAVEREAEAPLAAYRRLVEDAEARQELAAFIRGHVRERVDRADEQLRQAEVMAEHAGAFAKRLAALGITWNPQSADWQHRYQVEREIDKLDRRLGRWSRRALREHAQQLVAALDQLDEATAAEGEVRP